MQCEAILKVHGFVYLFKKTKLRALTFKNTSQKGALHFY
jgi:hypothetical protein